MSCTGPVRRWTTASYVKIPRTCVIQRRKQGVACLSQRQQEQQSFAIYPAKFFKCQLKIESLMGTKPRPERLSFH